MGHMVFYETHVQIEGVGMRGSTAGPRFRRYLESDNSGQAIYASRTAIRRKKFTKETERAHLLSFHRWLPGHSVAAGGSRLVHDVTPSRSHAPATQQS